MEDFIPNPDLEKKNNESPYFICTQCGECCHIREEKNIDKAQESKYFSYIYRKFGIIYLASLSEITINIWPEEKDALEKEAKSRGMELSIKPKRAVYDSKNDFLIILDYFIDHDICPFFDREKKLCTVYDKRPLICHSYPMLTTRALGKCKYKKLDLGAYKEEKGFAAKLENRTEAIKRMVSGMIEKGEIDNTLGIQELDSRIKKAKIKELKIATRE